MKKEAERQSSKCVQLPAFWRTSPITWFIRIESKFDVNGITDDELKFNYVVANLDSDTANKIREVFNNPNKANRYGQIKTALVKIFKKEGPENGNAEITGDGAAYFKQFLEMLKRLTKV